MRTPIEAIWNLLFSIICMNPPMRILFYRQLFPLQPPDRIYEYACQLYHFEIMGIKFYEAGLLRLIPEAVL